MPQLLRTLFLICFIGLLAACGNKGDLVKPGTTPVPAKTDTTR